LRIEVEMAQLGQQRFTTTGTVWRVCSKYLVFLKSTKSCLQRARARSVALLRYGTHYGGTFKAWHALWWYSKSMARTMVVL